jgi:hypothetical protein
VKCLLTRKTTFRKGGEGTNSSCACDHCSLSNASMPHLLLLSVYRICGFYSGADLCYCLWVMIHCSPVSGHLVFGGTYCLHLQGRSEGSWLVIWKKGGKWVRGYGSGQLEP